MRARLLASLLLLGTPVLAQSSIPTSPDEIRPLLIGRQAPALTLTAADGSAFDLDAALHAKPTVLIFYRGGW
jgi:hypothetical protein